MAKVRHLPLRSEDFYRRLQEAGILAEGDDCYGIVITAEPGNLVTIQTSSFADERLLSLAHHLPQLKD